MLRRLSSLVNPIRCKAKKGAAITGGEDRPSFNPGRPLEIQDNLDPREMITGWFASNKTRLIVYPFLFSPAAEVMKRISNSVILFSGFHEQVLITELLNH